ncbi:MAG: LysO family transporter [Bacteroidales bacterium]
MLTIVLIMLAGMLVGYFLRGQKKTLHFNGRLTIITIWLLLFFLGLSIGNNDHIMQKLPELGVAALWVSVAGVTGSVLSAWLVWKFFFASKGGKA